MRSNATAGSASSGSTGGKRRVKVLKEISATRISMGSGISCVVSLAAWVRSRLTTFSFCRSDQPANRSPRPLRRLAPLGLDQTIRKPPVLAPRSSATRPEASTPNSRACSILSPPRLKSVGAATTHPNGDLRIKTGARLINPMLSDDDLTRHNPSPLRLDSRRVHDQVRLQALFGH